MMEYMYTKEDLESFADNAKRAVMKSLVVEGALDFESAEEWCSTHTILLRKKNIFRTLTDRFRDTEDVDGHNIIVVVRADIPEDA